MSPMTSRQATGSCARAFGCMLLGSIFGCHADVTHQAFSCSEAPIEGADTVIRPGGVVVLGEMHGTEEAPAVVGSLACQASARQRVWVGLEIPFELDRLIEQLPTDLGAGTSLIQEPFWHRERQDGRSSAAMFALLQQIAELRRAGANISTFGFDSNDRRTERDADMATRILAHAKESAEGFMVALVGNVHPRNGAHASDGLSFTPMGVHLANALGSRFTALDIKYASGAVWACFADTECGVRPVSGTLLGREKFIEVFAQQNVRGFHGAYYLASLTPSPPAIIANPRSSSQP